MKHIDQEYCLPFDNTNPELWMRIEHLGRYVYASGFARRINAHSILDVACANGYGCIQMAQTDAHILGIDYNESLIKEARSSASESLQNNVHFRCADLNTDTLSDIPAQDLITCFDTLEHLVSPVDFLSKLSALQTKNGALLLSVPKAKYESVDNDGIPTNEFHLHRFTEVDMTDLLSSAGYQVSKTLYQPYTNMCMSLLNNACRDSGTSKQDAIAYFDQSKEALLFFARMFGVPTTDMKKLSYIVLYVAHKV
jgi:SAM-dependent methyltransferase